MRSLFGKIFLWFLLANTLVSGTFITLSIFLGPRRSYASWQAATQSMFSLATESVASKLSREGRQAVVDYITRLEQTGEVRGYLLDEKGDEIQDRQVPERAIELARIATDSDELCFRLRGRRAYAARRMTDHDGAYYVFVGEIPGFRRLTLPSSALDRTIMWGGSLLVVGVVCYWLARSFAKPLLKMRGATRQIAGGDLTVRVGRAVGRRRDEIGKLARDFDGMAARIESLMESQRRLLRDISHELRSPLARQSVALELAREGNDAEIGEALDRIEHEGQRLNELIGQLLTLTRLESRAAPLETTDLDLDRLVRQQVEDADFEARSRNRRVSLVRSEPCRVVGVPELLRRAVENVLRNAVRYTAEESAVEVSLACEDAGGGRQAVVRVRDHGPGVPDEALADIFRPFHRVGEARDRQSGGTGLGLAITYRAVLAHGGTVVSANAPDGGLAVEIRLPVPNATS